MAKKAGGRKGGKKVSNLKRKYHTYQKLSTRIQRHSQKKKERRKKKKEILKNAIPTHKPVVQPEEEEMDVEDMMDMIDPDYKTSKNKENEEPEYEKSDRHFSKSENVKHLLPIKTQKGAVVKRTMMVEEEQEKEEEILAPETKQELPPMSVAEIMERRKRKLEERKIKIGSLADSLLEQPEERTKNLVHLINLLDEPDVDISITVKKITSITLLEVFKDILPDYKIIHHNKEAKLKKTTKQLYGYENTLLDCYKVYLKKLERFTHILTKKGVDVANKQAVWNLGKKAVECLCELCYKYCYFNFGSNLIRVVVSFMNHRDPDVGDTACRAIQNLFRTDKQQIMAFEAVRYISHMAKRKRDDIKPKVLRTFLSLRLHVNLDAEKEEEIKAKKYMTYKEKRLHLSKRERKSTRFREKVEKELDAARAETNKQRKYKYQTDIIKQIFTVYFRILKRNPKCRLMAEVLEGLARFAHLINVEFFGDLVNVLHDLIKTDSLKYREYLHCVQTVFVILSGQGETLNIDPLRFYAHAYQSMFHVHAGESAGDMPTLLKTLEAMLIKRRKKVSVPRILAFSKRMATLSIHQHHAGAISLLSLLKTIFMFHSSTEILLDPNAGVGSGQFLPELGDPEHCNANTTCLWELHLAARSYNPDVRQVAKYILSGSPADGAHSLSSEFLRKPPLSVWEDYDFSDMKFKPSIPPPSNQKSAAKNIKHQYLYSEALQNEMENVLSSTPNICDFI